MGGRLARLQIATDITRLKQLEVDSKQTDRRLRQAQKLEAIGTLAGGIAHDFNNLLTGMLGSVSLMLFDIDETHPHHAMLQVVEKQIRSATRLARQLLGYARKGRYEIKTIDQKAMIREICEAFGRTCKDIRHHFDLDTALHPMDADEGQMEQVLWNLLVNASDAMIDGGMLSIRMRNVCHGDFGGHRYEPVADDYVQMAVADTGIGMTEEVVDRIFEPFFTTKEMGQGTGLGLASVYGILKGHRGYVDVESVPGGGTTFFVYLPASSRTILPLPDSVTDRKPVSGVVLLVDDESVVRQVGQKMLEKLGYESIPAGSGPEAVAICKERGPAIDAVILDMIMPDMGEAATYDALKSVDPQATVLLSSGYSLEGQAQSILDKGCDGFIQKPFSIDELSTKLSAILNKGD